MSGGTSTDPHDATARIAEQVRAASTSGTPLRIVGGGSKPFLGRAVPGETLDISTHRGIVAFEPTELVLTARAGTPLAEIEAALRDARQMLPFEPPHFGAADTLGGVLACGLSGPRRPFGGAARDLVLGTRIVTGRGQALRFGGDVIKNVAGYDISRLMVGAHGTLGVLLEASIKVLPMPAVERTVVLEVNGNKAVATMDRLAGKPQPLSGLAHHDGRLRVRLSGSEAGVAAAAAALGGEPLAQAEDWWRDLRDHRLAFFAGDAPLWRIALPPGCPPLALHGDWLLDWGGTQRWLRSRAEAEVIHAAAAAHGGHASCFRGAAGAPQQTPFQPLAAGVLALHRRLKGTFDPNRVLNRGRMYAGL